MKSKAALYIRVSTVEQTLHGYSLSAQESLLRQYAEAYDMTVVGVYADEGKSASKSLEKRTELLRLISDAEKGKVDVILFKDLTRWTRNASAYYSVQDRLDKCKVGWIAVEQPYLETVTPTGRFQTQIMLGTAQLEAEQTGQRIKFVQDSEIKRGHYPFPAHNAPTGYKTEKRADGNYLVIDEKTAPIIDAIFYEFRHSLNLKRVAEAIREKFDINYSVTTINRILRNPIYKGEFRGIPNFCEPIIPPDIFDQFQRPKRVYSGCKHRGEYFFSGIVKCAVCGSTMRGCCPDDKYHLYQCKNGCHNTITQRELEEKVLAQIAPELDRYKYIVKIRKKDNKAIAQQRMKLLQKKQRLTELYVDGLIERNEYDKSREEIELNLADLEPAPELPVIRTDFSSMYAKLRNDKKSALWNAFLSAITVHRDRHIDIAFHTAKVLAERMGMLDVPIAETDDTAE